MQPVAGARQAATLLFSHGPRLRKGGDTVPTRELTPMNPVGVQCPAHAGYPDAPPVGLRLGTAEGRWVIAVTVLGSGVAFLDGSIVNVALPRIQTGLGASLSDLQWIVDAYLLTLGSLLLVGGALGDLLGRRRVFIVGLIAFAVASAACGLAPTPLTLILARGLQGVAGALLVPGSLAIIVASFDSADRSRAIGAWSGLAGMSTALGPFAGGYLIDAASWRWAFLINLPLIAAAVIGALRHLPESAAPVDDETSLLRKLDLPGSVTAVIALGLLVLPLIEAHRLSSVARALLLAVGVGCFVLFLVIEHQRAARGHTPMLPLELFRHRAFTVANLVTFAVYGGLSVVLFCVSLELQEQMRYTALQAGAAFLPMTALLFLLSSRVGGLLPRVGPRLPLTLGPLMGAGGVLLLLRVQPGSSYVGAVLPQSRCSRSGCASWSHRSPRQPWPTSTRTAASHRG